MGNEGQSKRIELLEGVDPEKVREYLESGEAVNPDDPDAEYLYGNDPEADAKFVRDRRSDLRRQLFSSGAQFVLGIMVMFVALGLVIMAITNPRWPYIVPAALVAPIAAWFFRARWRRWLGTAPYCYRLLQSLGEDADNVLIEHRKKQRQKYAKKIGTLHGDPFGEKLATEGREFSVEDFDIPDDFDPNA